MGRREVRNRGLVKRTICTCQNHNSNKSHVHVDCYMHGCMMRTVPLSCSDDACTMTQEQRIEACACLILNVVQTVWTAGATPFGVVPKTVPDSSLCWAAELEDDSVNRTPAPQPDVVKPNDSGGSPAAESTVTIEPLKAKEADSEQPHNIKAFPTDAKEKERNQKNKYKETGIERVCASRTRLSNITMMTAATTCHRCRTKAT